MPTTSAPQRPNIFIYIWLRYQTWSRPAAPARIHSICSAEKAKGFANLALFTEEVLFNKIQLPGIPFIQFPLASLPITSLPTPIAIVKHAISTTTFLFLSFPRIALLGERASHGFTFGETWNLSACIRKAGKK